MKISACYIVKGSQEEATYLDQSLASVAPYVDEVCVTITHLPGEKRSYHVEKVAKKYKAKISDFEWIDDFSAARNYAASQCTGGVYIWLDADDVLEHGEKLRELCENMPAHISVGFVNYDYETDPETGQVRTKHWRDRIIRNDGSVVWKGRLHETPVETRRSGKAEVPELNVVHMSKPDRWEASQERNVRILEKQLEDEKDSPDPRTMFYLGSAYKVTERYQEAIQLFEFYLQLSGWDEERAICWQQLGEMYEMYERDTDAVNAYLQCIREREDFPVGYVALGQYYAAREKHEKAIHWLEMGIQKGEPKTSMVINPLDYTYKPFVILAECWFNLGQFDKAIWSIKEAQKYRKDDLTEQLLMNYQELVAHKQACESVAALARFLEKVGEGEKVPQLLDATPAVLSDNPLMLKIRKKYSKPKVWPKKSVVIFTGQSVLGEWGPWSLEEGIGGSEEAIIRLIRRLLEQGYAVTVYANPGARAGTVDGVEWRNYWELDLRDTFDVFVAWRSPWFFDAKVNARKKYLWLHDVMPIGEFTPERLDNLDKVIVLSEYHRNLFPNIPDDKIFLSANGIDAEEFEAVERGEADYTAGYGCEYREKIQRDPHLIVYQSSHVRGLSYLYDIWPEVRKVVPDARLRVMYGWASFIAVHKDNPERMAWMEEMKQRARDLDGVEDIGKVSQRQIVEELLSAGVWAYPCPFPEIYAITAAKAQAGGAVPVSSDYAALKETVKFGVKIPFEEWNETTRKAYTESLIDMLQDVDKQERIRQEMIPAARKIFSWAGVAQSWDREFQS